MEAKTAVFQKRGGFTLLEILITLVILGVIAGLAFPVISAQVERSRAQEAIEHLEAVKGALGQYYALNKTYLNASIYPSAVAPAVYIGYDPNTAGAGQTSLFSYTIGNLDVAAYTVTAQREPSASNVGNTVVLDKAASDPTGKVTKNGVYT